MNNNTFSLLGLCRKANKLSMGHDMCKSSVRSRKAELCIVSSESSQRIVEEFRSLCKSGGIRFFRIPLTIDEIHHITGCKAGIITVDDSGFAKAIVKNFENNSFVEEIDI